jgi:hypothetical protein
MWVMFNNRSRPLYPRERDPIPIVQDEGWDPRPVWTSAENLVPTGTRPRDGPARSEPPHRLSYAGLHVSVTFNIWQSSQLKTSRALEPNHNVVESTANSSYRIKRNNNTIEICWRCCDEIKTRKSKIICRSFLPTDLHQPRFPTLQISYRHIEQAEGTELAYKTLAEDEQLCTSAEKQPRNGRSEAVLRVASIYDLLHQALSDHVACLLLISGLPVWQLSVLWSLPGSSDVH